MDSWFFMRPGFSTFRLEPDRHKQFLFGFQERAQRDYLMREVEGASYSSDGHKAVVFGDYGRGKTHLCQNLSFEIARRHMNILPVYVKCSAYGAKESFSSFFKELVARLRTEELRRVATDYARRVQAGEATPLADVINSEDIAFVMTEGLAAVSMSSVRNSMRWLGGEAKVPMGNIEDPESRRGRGLLKPQLDDSIEFGTVMRGLAHLFREVDNKVLLFLVDEAERFQNVTHVDTYWKWLAALRELTEIVGTGMMFFIGAVSRNDLPAILVQDEIVRRVGVANYVEFQNPSREDLSEFLVELFATFIRKGEVPELHRNVLPPEALGTTVPPELAALTEGDPARLKAFPFEPAALDEFVGQLATGTRANKPSEALIRLQKVAQRAIGEGKRVIDSPLVEAAASEGF
jgi:hypothetical protein